MPTLGELLSTRVRPSPLAEPLPGNRLRCLACGHRCPIADGQAGVCKVRFHRDGQLWAPWGYVAGAHNDPIEKKPFFHVKPGSWALSFGMLGCNLHCSYCQNWLTSQALRDPDALAPPRSATPEELVSMALEEGAQSLVSTYNEPLITAEWAAAIFDQARAAGLMTGFVSNGNATPEALEFLRPRLDFYKVDLKTFDKSRYRDLGARIEPILDSIRLIHELGFWLEVVTLVVPGFNDSDEELGRIAGFLAGVSPFIPWHLTAFHPDYRMHDRGPTSGATLLRAAGIGRQAGLRYVYAGNLPGAAGELESTFCHHCGTRLVRRLGFAVLENRIGPGGHCPNCSTLIPGRW